MGPPCWVVARREKNEREKHVCSSPPRKIAQEKRGLASFFNPTGQLTLQFSLTQKFKGISNHENCQHLGAISSEIPQNFRQISAVKLSEAIKDK